MESSFCRVCLLHLKAERRGRLASARGQEGPSISEILAAACIESPDRCYCLVPTVDPMTRYAAGRMQRSFSGPLDKSRGIDRPPEPRDHFFRPTATLANRQGGREAKALI